MQCPRCQQFQEDGAEECANCGVVFSRYRPRPAAAPEPAAPAWRAWLLERLFDVAPGVNRARVAVQGLFLLLLACAALMILTTPMRGPALVGSSLHWLDLPFHEAGHVVFSPFGAFLHILGGTLGQLLVPLLVACAFLKEGNPFGASACVWWLGQSCTDCSPYIADARDRLLLLTSGESGQTDWEGHDWYQLLHRTGLLAHDQLIARTFWLAGLALMIAALAWGAYILRRQWEAAAKD